MKKWKMIVCLLAMLPVVPVAKAQDFSSPGGGFGFGAQYWHLDEMSDLWDSGGMWGGALTIRIRPMKYIGIDLRGGYMMTQRDDGTFCDRYIRDNTLWCVPLEAGLVVMYPIADVLLLYGGGGPGFYIYGESADVLERRGRRNVYVKENFDCENDVGWYAVAGVNFRLGQGVSLFVEGRYTDTELSFKDLEKYTDGDTSYGPDDCSGFGVQLGLMFGF